MTTTTEFPKIELPDVDPAKREAVEEILTAVDEHAAHIHRQQVGIVKAMFALKKPLARRGRTARKRRTTTKHVKHMRNVAARAEWA